jgi:hypothetical protein
MGSSPFQTFEKPRGSEAFLSQLGNNFFENGRQYTNLLRF